ncbi:MAG: heme-binding protein [Hyphomonadaceae bacterium]|nr:heme-binding protein [Hyphomonadaceae bacterium]
MRLSILALLAAAPVFAAGAQTPQPTLDLHSAAVIRDACLSHAKENSQMVAVAVCDQAGDMMAYARMDGTLPAAADIAQWKGKSAALYQRPTTETAEWNAPEAPHISTFMGGLPIFTGDGAPLGGVGVSGAPSEFDEACGGIGIEAAELFSARPEAGAD